MHGPTKVTGGIRHLGYHRGCYQLVVKNLGCLGKESVIESNTFQIGGFQWKLVIVLGFRNCGPHETVRVSLLSCNDVPVYADVNLSIDSREKEEICPVKRTKKLAGPFSSLDRQYLPFDRLMDAKERQQICETLVIVADLKNVRVATDAESRTTRVDARTVTVEVIDHNSINKLLNRRKTPAVISSDYKRNSDVCSRSYVQLWAEQNPDCRYWLCERSRDGNVIVKGCLDDFEPLKSFASICNDVNGVPWVTVFKEEKKSNENFQPIDKDTVVVFCMLNDASNDDLSYLGHLLLRKTTQCLELSKRVTDDMEHIDDNQRYSLHLLEGSGLTTDITDMASSLNECGVYSGSIVVVRSWPANEDQICEECLKEAYIPDQNGRKGDDVNDELQNTESLVSATELSGDASDDDSETLSDRVNNTFETASDEAESDPNEDASLSLAERSHQRMSEDDIQLQRIEATSLAKTLEETDLSSVAKDVHPHKHTSLPATCVPTTDETAVGEADESVEIVDSSEGDSSEEIMKEVTQVLKELHKEFVTNIQKEVKEPIINEIKQVDAAVADIKSDVTATYQEMCKANLMADVQMEQLTENDTQLPLMDRVAQEAFMMADDFVTDPIFLLDFRKDYRMRIQLVHKHQRDASSFRIKYVSVKPSDGQELGLETFELKQRSEGSEVVALVQFDKFQSVRLSSKSPQFGTVQEKYVSLPITIGVESSSLKPTSQSSDFELNGRILCRMSSGIDVMKIRRFKRFALKSWMNSPQWIRDGAKGAVFLASRAVDGATRTGPWTLFPQAVSVISALFVLPCFRLDAGQLVE